MSDYSGNILTNSVLQTSGKQVFTKCPGNILTNSVLQTSGKQVFTKCRGGIMTIASEETSDGGGTNIVRFFYKTIAGSFMNTIVFEEIPSNAIILRIANE